MGALIKFQPSYGCASTKLAMHVASQDSRRRRRYQFLDKTCDVFGMSKADVVVLLRVPCMPRLCHWGCDVTVCVDGSAGFSYRFRTVKICRRQL